MVPVDGEVEDKLTNSYELKWRLNDPIGQLAFRFSHEYHHHFN